MATTSMTKDFVINNPKAFEQLKKDLNSISKNNVKREVKDSSSLIYGEQKLKRFLSR